MAHLIRHESHGPSTGGSTASSSSSSSASSDYSPRSNPSSDRPSLESDRDLFLYDSYDSSGESGTTGQGSNAAHYQVDDSTYPTRVSSRASSPTPGPDPWEGYLGYRSRNRSKHASGTSTPNIAATDKESADYYRAHYSQTTALLNKLGGTVAPENTPLGSPVLQHQKRRAGWWARRAEKGAWHSTSRPSKHSKASSRRKRSCVQLFWSALLRQPWVPTQPLTILFFILLFGCFAATVTTFLTHILSNDKQRLPWRTFCQNQRDFPHDLADALAPVNVFVGVFSVDAAYERRQLIRSTYARLSGPVDPVTGRPGQNVQVKFILGRPRPKHARRIALEMETFNDVVVLDLKENMNRGKTHAFFTWASENATVPVYFRPDQSTSAQIGFKRADYVVKADDDTFIVLSELERHLRITPRQKTYWGYLIRNLFMGGEIYALSSDLVDYVASYEPLLAHSTGAEDKKVAKWMRLHPEATTVNWISERCWIYDHPKAGTTYSHGFLFPDEVERIRIEGRRGLSDEEKERRGGVTSQSYSTVTQWKSQYRRPAEAMSIEEEVEALIEGGGRWSATGWLADSEEAPRYVPAELLVFDPQDRRLTDPLAVNRASVPASDVIGVKPGVPDRLKAIPSARTTRFGKDLFRRPEDVEVMRKGVKLARRGETDSSLEVEIHNAVMPDVDEEDEVGEGDRLQPVEPEGVPSLIANETSPPEGQLRLPPATNYRVPHDNLHRFVPEPTLRYDRSALRLREQRMLGRPHGGTVAVHFLKRNEWFYEAALALLGRHRMWDHGHEAPAFVPQAQDHPITPFASEIDLRDEVRWRGVGSVEAVPALWGSARMYGSPIVHENGMISEGRPLDLTRQHPSSAWTSSKLGGLRGTPKLGFALDSGTSRSTESTAADAASTHVLPSASAAGQPVDQVPTGIVVPTNASAEAGGAGGGAHLVVQAQDEGH